MHFVVLDKAVAIDMFCMENAVKVSLHKLTLHTCTSNIPINWDDCSARANLLGICIYSACELSFSTLFYGMKVCD